MIEREKTHQAIDFPLGQGELGRATHLAALGSTITILFPSGRGVTSPTSPIKPFHFSSPHASPNSPARFVHLERKDGPTAAPSASHVSVHTPSGRGMRCRGGSTTRGSGCREGGEGTKEDGSISAWRGGEAERETETEQINTIPLGTTFLSAGFVPLSPGE